MEWSNYKKFIYTIAVIVVLLECLFAEIILSSWIVIVLVIIVDLNLGFLLWRMDQIGDDLDEYDEE